MDNYGILSLAPALIAVILAFITREALFSILCGVLVGLLITGQDLLFGFTGLIQSALGNADYIWVIGIEVFIGIMVAFFQKYKAQRSRGFLWNQAEWRPCVCSCEIGRAHV